MDITASRKAVLKQEEKIRDIQKDLFTLANYYFVFQGVIFTAVFNSSTALKCKFRWLPITLSLIAGLLNFMVFFKISRRYLELLMRQDINLQLLALSNQRKKLERERAVTEGEGPSEVEDQRSNLEVVADPNSHTWRRVIFYLCMLLFLGFIAVNVIASTLILCRENHCTNYYDKSTCLNLCDQEKCLIVCLLH